MKKINIEKIKEISSSKLIRSILIISFFLFVIFKLFFKSDLAPPQDTKVVESYIVKLGDITSTTKLIAEVKAKDQSLLISQEVGIFHIIKDSGSQVKKGDLIALIENKDIEKNYKLMLKAEEIARIQLERAKRLFQANTYNKTEYENAKNIHLIAQKNLADSLISYKKLNFYAPFEGIVGPYKFRSGDQINLNEKVVTIYNPALVRVHFEIPSSVINQVKSGQKVKIFYNKHEIPDIQKIIDKDTNATPVFVEIPCENCIIGATISVELDLTSKENVIVVPYEAVFLKEGKNFVYVIKDNELELRPVVLGIKEKDLVEITEGLKEGEEIVSTSTARLYPGLNVKVYTEKNNEDN